MNFGYILEGRIKKITRLINFQMSFIITPNASDHRNYLVMDIIYIVKCILQTAVDLFCQQVNIFYDIKYSLRALRFCFMSTATYSYSPRDMPNFLLLYSFIHYG